MPVLENDEGREHHAENQRDLHGTVDRRGPKQRDRACDQNDQGNKRNNRIHIRRFFDVA